jgi:hypothetical protein
LWSDTVVEGEGGLYFIVLCDYGTLINKLGALISGLRETPLTMIPINPNVLIIIGFSFTSIMHNGLASN